MLDLVGQILFVSILGTPLLGWLIVRKKENWSGWEKLMAVIAIALVSSFFFFIIAMHILLRGGLGP